MARLSDLAIGQPKWDVVALTGDSAGVLPEHWNDWPQPLKLSVPGNHDSPETFLHLTVGFTTRRGFVVTMIWPFWESIRQI
jgi:hypothetical protein